MVQFFYTSQANYAPGPTPNQGEFNGISDFDPPRVLDSSATDDLTWDVGDPWSDGSSILYQGYYEADGHTFLVFRGDNGNTTTGDIRVISATAPSTSSGYATDSAPFPDIVYATIPPLTTTALVACFLSGTKIATPVGETLVEDLKIGDLVTIQGKDPVPVKWIGRQTILTMFGPPERLMPVRLQAGALGPGMPKRDLTLTSDHALVIDDLLINAGALVNGHSITWVPVSEFGDRYTVYHVETEGHDVILADGTPAETFVDYASRKTFENYDEYLALYAEDESHPLICESQRVRITSQRLVPDHIKQRLGIASEADQLNDLVRNVR